MAVKGEGFRSTCRECQRYMRPQYAGKDEWPGTVLHGGCGYCYNCRRAMRKAGRTGEPVAAPRPPRALDPDEVATLRLLEKYGLAEEMRAMLGLDETERPQPLSDIQMMKNSLTAPGGGAYGLFADGDNTIRTALTRGSVKGRRL